MKNSEWLLIICQFGKFVKHGIARPSQALPETSSAIAAKRPRFSARMSV